MTVQLSTLLMKIVQQNGEERSQRNSETTSMFRPVPAVPAVLAVPAVPAVPLIITTRLWQIK